MKDKSVWTKFGYFWVTGIFFLFSILGHWIMGWYEYVNEQQSLRQPIEIGEYIIKTARGTLENWQSEFLQLMWQVGGLSILYYLGSPQSKEGDERKEEKIDEILRRVGGRDGIKAIDSLDRKYPRV